MVRSAVAKIAAIWLLMNADMTSPRAVVMMT
jgi:hypothetical protein